MEINPGDTAWVLVASAMVLLMTPGLALFYGGMTRAKSTLNMMMMSFSAIGVVTVLWVAFGYALAFGDSGSPWYGAVSGSNLGSQISSLVSNGAAYPIPVLAFAGFQLMFAIITPALISGAIADRAKFATWVVFVALWSTVVYFPVAHWVFDFGGADSNGAGWLAARGVLDFAGGTAVHINAGAAGLALALVLGKRVGWRREPMRPHNLPLVLSGAGLLWFGWFGFNAGSSLGANATAALAFVNTQAATGAALLGWLLVERRRDGHATSLGAASGAIAGLVAITPACAYVDPWGAIVIGLVAGAACALAIGLKYRLGFDDSLDVVGVHLVGGLIGCLMIGLVATRGVNEFGGDGLFHGGGLSLLGKQALGSFSVLAYSFIVTYLLGTILERTMGFRVTRDQEIEGVDLTQHAETGYDLEGRAGGGTLAGITTKGA